MKLTVSHTTRYTYSEPQLRVSQSQRLYPADFDGQTVLEWNATTTDGIVGSEFRDGAGDLTQTVVVKGLIKEIAVTVQGIVEVADTAGVLRGHREKVQPFAYRSATRATRADVAIRELARSTLEGLSDTSPLGRAHALCEAVTEAIKYQPGETEPQTTAADALELGKGVCQDHTHALIALALTCEIPARYVAGYLYAGADDDETVAAMAQAGHAWAELYIEGLGWVGFDAANACCPDDRYIRLCSGTDAQDAAPIRGIANGPGDELLEVDVAVQAVQQ